MLLVVGLVVGLEQQQKEGGGGQKKIKKENH